jgi:hypothetical protein
LFVTDGPKLASDVTGIPKRTVNAWAKAEGWRRPTGTHQATGQPRHLHVAAAPQTRQPTPKGQVASLGYGYQRRALLRQLGDEARECLTALARDREAGKSGAARNWAWCVGILIERAELVAKAAGPDLAGDRPDTAEVVTRLQEMAADLASRGTGSDGQPR